MGHPLLKDQVHLGFATSIGKSLHKVQTSFDYKRFKKELERESSWESLELKQRIQRTARAVVSGYVREGEVFSAVRYRMFIRDAKKVISEFTGLGVLVFPEVIEQFGVEFGDQAFEDSIDALEFFTPFMTSEFAVRAFLNRYPKRMRDVFLKWSQSPHEHVRRLSSEGCRPKLPWGKKVQFLLDSPDWSRSILDRLVTDDSDYVRKSVANHLNDICKIDRELALDIAGAWSKKFLKSKVDLQSQVGRVIRHGLRTLLKRGDPDALERVGIKATPVRVIGFGIDPKVVSIGTRARIFCALVPSQSGQGLRGEYRISFLTPSGKVSKKVFLWFNTLSESKELSFSREHSFRQMTTRRHVPGTHQIELIVNGKSVAVHEFRLIRSLG